jgi:CheY-like chemotaxis protein/anti-sigma regulatory factor (Ser/Thr protein kinase)
MSDSQPTLLIVDDEALNLDIITEFLDGQGYALVRADGGEAAWGLLMREPERFEAVIVDRMMPGTDGMEVLRRIKADERTRFLPVVMQTAAAAPGQVAEGLAAGAWYYLTKPYRPEALQSVVRTVLGDRRGQQQVLRLSENQRAVMRMLREGAFRVRTLDDARCLAAALAQAAPDSSAVALGLSELLINAVEHGNLGISYEEKGRLLAANDWEAEVRRRLDDPAHAHKVVEVRFTQSPESMTVVIADQGEGFDWTAYLEISPERAFDAHGRGIALARRLAFDQLEYRGNGNRVEARIRLT